MGRKRHKPVTLSFCKKCNECPYKELCCPTHGNPYFKTRHHLFYPSTLYKSRLERKFRQHPLNSEYICRYIHDLIHIHQEAPEKPSRDYMRQWLLEHPI